MAKVDWKLEAPHMEKVYTNAAFNICASWGDELGGLFSSRDPDKLQKIQVNYPCSALEKTYPCLLVKASPRATWETQVEGSPLNARGWVFQEQLLSSANLHFSRGEVFFECLEMRASESLGTDQGPRPRIGVDVDQNMTSSWNTFRDRDPSGQYPLYLKDHMPIANISFRPEAHHSDSPSRNDDDIYRLWHSMVEKYTVKGLTFHEDRLVAIAGLARSFQKLLSNADKFIAGLWHGQLALEMMWHASDEVGRGKGRDAWEDRRSLLTFSWISIKAGISYQYVERFVHLRDLVVEVESVSVRQGVSHAANESDIALGGTDQEPCPFEKDIFALPFAAVVEIKVTGRLGRMTLRSQENPTQLLGAYAVTGAPKFEEYASFTETVWTDTWLDYSISPAQIHEANVSRTLFYMEWATSSSELFDTKGWLILLELVDAIMARYRRIGMTRVSMTLDAYLRKMSDPTARRHFVLSTENDTHDLPCWKYNDVTKEHTIFIL